MAAQSESTELVPAPGNYGVQLVPAEGSENAVGFEDARLFDTGYGTYGKYQHPKGGVVTILADTFSRRLYQNKGFKFLGYSNGLAEPANNEAPAYVGPTVKEITDEQINQQKARVQELLEHGGSSKEEIEATLKAIESRLRRREVPTGQTLPGMLAAEGYNRGVPGLDPTMEAPAPGAATEQRAIPGGYLVTVPQPAQSSENGNGGNGEPIQPSQPALPPNGASSATSPQASDPMAPADSSGAV